MSPTTARLGSGEPGRADELQRMPKIELHAHLEGCVRPQTFIDLAQAHDISLPTRDPDLVYAYTDMASFMDVFERLSLVLQTRADFARVVYESLTDAASSNTIYREIFFDPTVHPSCDYPEMLLGLRAGLSAAEADHGILARLIPSVYRGHSASAALDMVRQVVAHPCDEVVGIGMDGDELAGPPLRFVEAYRLAGEAGLQRTAHAGERFSAEEVRECLEVLGCTRIDHGYGVLADDDLVTRCRDHGTHFTYAWLSTQYNYHGDLEDHPFEGMRRAGLSMSLGGDDPAMGGTDLTGDYLTVATALDWPAETFRAQALQALDAAWCTEDDKARLRPQFIETASAPQPKNWSSR